AVVRAMPTTARVFVTSSGVGVVTAGAACTVPATEPDTTWSPAVTAPSATVSCTWPRPCTVTRCPVTASCAATPTTFTDGVAPDVGATVPAPDTCTSWPPAIVADAVSPIFAPGMYTGE